MERDGPMCRSDCPEGDDARRAVRLEESVWDFVRRDVSFEFRRGVDRDVRDWAHASELSVGGGCDDDDDDDDDDSSSWLLLVLLLVLEDMLTCAA